MKDGTLRTYFPVGKTGTPEVAPGTGFSGSNVTISGAGIPPEQGYVKLSDNMAKYLYTYLPGSAQEGAVSESNLTSAMVKTVGQVKCYQTINTTPIATQCLIKIDSTTGAVLAPTAN